jgi:Ca2+/H+ antiporter
LDATIWVVDSNLIWLLVVVLLIIILPTMLLNVPARFTNSIEALFSLAGSITYPLIGNVTSNSNPSFSSIM